MSVLIFVVIVTALVSYFLTPEERIKALRACGRFARRAGREVIGASRPPDDGSQAPPVAVMTWFLVLVNVWVFAGLLFGKASTDQEALLAWGGSFGPRTTNGEWWRLFTSTFVHTSTLHLLATLAGLVPIACITERLVGPVAFASAYVAAGTLANLARLSRSPVTVSAGGAAAVLGIYGLLIATATWGLLRRERVSIPWRTMKRLLPGVAFFLLYSAATGRVDRPVAAIALAGGAITGLLLAKGARDHKPAVRRTALLALDTAALIVLFAVPLRGMADVRPTIGRVIAMEERTARAYDAAVARFNTGAIRAAALAQVIDETVMPNLLEATREILALQHVPRDHQPVVARAEEYLRLRIECWHLRSEALDKGRIGLLKEADRKEWQALEALEQVRADLGRQPS